MKKISSSLKSKNKLKNRPDFQAYYVAVHYLENLVNLPLKHEYMRDRANRRFYLKRMRYFLELIGNPDSDMKFIHITGTAGKGTVATMIHEVLFRAGKNVGSMTSPFVTSTIEKIKVGDHYIDPQEFAEIVAWLKPFVDKAYASGLYGRPSYFEMIFAITLIYFKRRKCDMVVLEVGCGGRYDYTNVIKDPIVTAITNIDYDHTELLGNTLWEIAHEKAGIIKSRSVFFTTERRSALLKYFASVCRRQKVKMQALPASKEYYEANKSLASAVCRSIGVSEHYINEGISSARLPGRFEKIQDAPQVIIDGAHNPIKMQSTVDNIGRLKYRRLFLILAIGSNKDSRKILKKIVPLADSVFFTRFSIPERKPFSPLELSRKARRFRKAGSSEKIYLEPPAALNDALSQASRDDLIVVTGSFYLAGELRERWISEEWVLAHRRSF